MATPKKRPEDYLPTGRPTDYKPEYCEEVIRLLNKGWSKAELCRHFQVAKSTLQLWEQTHPAFSAAINKGSDFAEGWWIKQCRKNIKNKEFNSRLFELNMMNRFGWSRKANEQHNVNVTHEETLESLA